ncbi:hypothetical protein [Devosia sp.]|uniref:hypothetical protein n=1 Tax=Devosia sp. TaxID=1871048 RepID=UPI0025CBBD57|nr:hypothetical protein [Devosia sp.]MCR6635436.1 hypothetical protein [Devosia sp.]
MLQRLFLVLTVTCATPAFAQSGFTSAYTDLDIAQCLVLEADDFGASWACPGYKGFPVMVEEGDLRFSISYGFDPEANSAGFQTLPPFNNLGAKLEWRLSNAKGYFFPVATIVRYHTADPETGENKGQVLVVTQIAEGNSCHIAYVDALANKDANELARAAADKAGKFDCANDEPEVIGEFSAY